MSGVPILYQNSFIINSFYCQFTNSNNIKYYLDVDDNYIKKVNKIAVTKIFIPNKVYQFDSDEYFILQEGINPAVNISIGNKSYLSFIDLANDFQSMLTSNSPNGFTYTVSIIPNTNNTLKISVNDLTLPKKIIVPNVYLQLTFGITSSGVFYDEFITDVTTLSPIDMIFINSNGVANYNNNDSSSILGVYDLRQVSSLQQTDIFTAMKNFNNVKDLTFILTDFNKNLINLNNKPWWFEIQLFYYDEGFIEKLKNYIDLKTYDIVRKNEIDKFKKQDELEKKNNKNIDAIINN